MTSEQDLTIKDAYQAFTQIESAGKKLQTNLSSFRYRIMGAHRLYRWLLELMSAQEVDRLQQELHKLQPEMANKKVGLDRLLGMRSGTYNVESVTVIREPFSVNVGYFCQFLRHPDTGSYVANCISNFVKVQTRLRKAGEAPECLKSGKFLITENKRYFLTLPEDYRIRVFPRPDSVEVCWKKLKPSGEIKLLDIKNLE